MHIGFMESWLSCTDKKESRHTESTDRVSWCAVDEDGVKCCSWSRVYDILVDC